MTPQEKSSLGVFIGKSKTSGNVFSSIGAGISLFASMTQIAYNTEAISLPSVNPVTVVLLKPHNLSCKGHWLINAIQKHCPEVKT